MYGRVSPINLPPRYSSIIRKSEFPTSLQLPEYVKCSTNPIIINSTRDFGLPEKGQIRDFGARKYSNVWKDNPAMEEPVAKGGINDSAEDASIDEVFKLRAAKKDCKLAKEDWVDSELKELERDTNRRTTDAAKIRRQMIRRSNAMAKQVISIRSALSLGFVSQLWIDTSSVGDVILVEDETVMENDLKLVGLETLCYNTKASKYRQGIVESLELDAFGISLLPSSLVSTYSLPVGDVVEVFADTVVVGDAAVLHLQRLTKGFWDGQYTGNSNKEFQEQDDYADYSGRPPKSKRKRRRHTRKYVADGWELPMDYI